LLVAVVIVAVVFFLGARDREPPTPPPTPPPSPEQAREAAKKAVVAYMRHLEDGDYAAAHRLLSEASRKRHPLAGFRRQAEQGITYYDLSSARVKLTQPERAEVTLQLEGDPASAAITAVREQDRWRVVYLRGRPGFPYP